MPGPRGRLVTATVLARGARDRRIARRLVSAYDLEHPLTLQPHAAGWLVGGGRMGELVGTFDWSHTPLGPLARWPESLRSAAALALAAELPLAIAWGERRVLLYNDAYVPVLAVRHPRALGSDFKECWSPTWRAIGAAFERAAAGHAAQVPGERAAPKSAGEAGARTFSFSPIPDERGRVAGVLHAVTETHGPALAARQAGLLHAEDELRARGERLRLLWEAARVVLTADDPDTMLQRLFAKVAAQLPVDVYFNYMVDDAGGALLLASCAGIDPAEFPRLRRLEFGQAVCGTVARERRALVATSIQQSADPRTALVKGFGIRAYACNPLLAGSRLLGTLSFASRTRDQFTADELEFFATISHYVTAAYRHMRLIAELREADRRKDQFVATLAHELRNPLAPLRTSLAVLELGARDPDAVGETCAVMQRQVEQLTRLVDDLLEMSRITQGKLVLRRCPVALAEVVRRAVESTRSLLDQAGHRLSVTLPPEPVFLDADPVRMVQVLANLLGNAAKYTPEGGNVEVRAEAGAGGVVIAVIDDGIGIAPEDAGRIFEMFAQVDRSLETGFKGLGIGLTLVKSLVELHGGEVTVHSEGPGRGSTFRVRLPTVAPPERVEAPTPAGPGMPRHRVLVVEDHKDAAHALARLLRVLGHEVRVAHDGLDAVHVVAAWQPHLVLLDLGLPKLNGYDAAARIRALPGGDRIVLAAVTGWGQEHDRQRTRAAGFDRHVTKPADPAALHELLAAVPPHDQVDPPAPAAEAEPAAPGAPTAPAATGDRRRKLVHDLRSTLNALVLQLRVIEQTTTHHEATAAAGAEAGSAAGAAVAAQVRALALRALHAGRQLDGLIGQIAATDALGAAEPR